MKLNVGSGKGNEQEGRRAGGVRRWIKESRKEQSRRGRREQEERRKGEERDEGRESRMREQERRAE